MQPLHTIFTQNSLYVFNFYRLCQVSIHSCCQTLFFIFSECICCHGNNGIVSASGCFSDRIVFVAVSPSITGSMELLNAHLLVSLQICIKTHFYITTKFFTLQCTYLFRRCFSCFLFQKIATKGAHLKISFQMRPFAFFFSVRSIRNAPSPLPRRPARRYRLRTLCTDPEPHHVFQAQWCVRRTGTW